MGCCHSKPNVVLNINQRTRSCNISEQEFLEIVEWDINPQNEEYFEKLCDLIRQGTIVNITGKYNTQARRCLEMLVEEFSPTNNHIYPST